MIDFFRELFVKRVKLDTKVLPSQGLFYKPDFEINIKKASKEDILDYEKNYVKDDIGTVIYLIKKIVEKNTKLSQGYIYEDIKSIDIIFIFLEIVKITKGKPINLMYFDKETDSEGKIEFGSKYFNYFQFNNKLLQNYNNEDRSFTINGYKYTLPSIGVENALTNFLIIKSSEQDAFNYNNYTYDFTYFVGDKNTLKFKEIENLIQIFNFDMDKDEMKKMKEVIKTFLPLQRYSLKKDGRVVEMNSKINLEKIWK
jgi:hypothetical protein